MPAEAKAAKVEKPDIDMRNTHIEREQKKIEGLKKDIARIGEQISNAAKQNTDNPRQRLTAELRTLNEEISNKAEERKNIRSSIDTLDEQRRDTRQALTSDAYRFKNVDEIDAEIRGLEFRLETQGTGNLKRDKRLMTEIKNLQACKALVRQKSGMDAKVEELKVERDDLWDRLRQLSDELDDLRANRDQLRQKLTEASNSQEDAKFKRWKEDRENKREQINEAYTAITKIKEDFGVKMQQWRDYQDVLREEKRKEQQALREKREAERAERDKERAERMAARKKRENEAERLRRQNPYEKEIDTCKNLINFLEKINSTEQRKTAASVSFDAQGAAPKAGLQVFKREDEDNWLFGDRTKKKAAPKKPAPKKEGGGSGRKIGTLSYQQVQGFLQLDVPQPKVTTDIPDTVKLLREKQKEFEGHRRTEEEVDAEMEEEQAKQAASKEAQEAAAAPAGDESATPAAE